MKKLLPIVLLALACASEPPPPSPVSGPYSPDSGSLLVRCGRLIDGVSDDVRTGVDIYIANGRIEAIGEDVAAPRGTPLLDLSRFTVLPGLIDMHTHLADRPGSTADLSVYFTFPRDQQLAQARENARVTLDAGFTSVRDVGTYVAFMDKALRDEIDAGSAAGPRMQVAGYYLSIPGGGGDLVIPGFDEKDIPERVRQGIARGEEEFRRKAQAAIDGGADVLKVIASGAVLAYGGVPGEPEMTEEEIRAVAEVAHAAGKKLAAHAHGTRSIQEAIRAGADTIEHASLIDDATIALAAERKVALSMDVYNGDYIATEGRRQNWPEEFLRKNEETTEAQRQAFTKAYHAGVPIVFGTDSAVYPHGDNAKQFRIMVERGMAPMDAIRAATAVAARYMGWADRVGAIEKGRFGDLIAVEGDPLEDITRLENVRVVVKGGLVFKEAS
ncbi:MAG TPA: amidohydrolase family protein [Vicinamibacteria bacterium]|nr:amidohydrolase family protein [Vicinamibacteria bacterium]